MTSLSLSTFSLFRGVSALRICYAYSVYFLYKQHSLSLSPPHLITKASFSDTAQVAKYKDPRDACAAIVAESYRLWLQYETRTDDITVIVVHVNGLNDVRRLLDFHILYLIRAIFVLIFLSSFKLLILVFIFNVRLHSINQQVLLHLQNLLCLKWLKHPDQSVHPI